MHFFAPVPVGLDAEAERVDVDGIGDAAWLAFPLGIVLAMEAVEEAETDMEDGTKSVSTALGTVEDCDSVLPLPVLPLPVFVGGVETVPQSPVIPAPAFGVIPLYFPPYFTFFPGFGKTTSVHSTVLQLGAASTLATKGAG